MTEITTTLSLDDVDLLADGLEAVRAARSFMRRGEK